MAYEVRRLRPDELDIALELAMETFLQFEAPDYGPDGVKTFRQDLIDNPQFRENCQSGKNRMWGAFDGEKLICVFVIRGASHITLVFTHRDYHRQGVASAVFGQLLRDIRLENPELTGLTLNSSPYGKPFYHHIGFYDTDVETTANGIRYTPMKYDL